MDDLAGIGLYSIQEAARLTHAKPAEVRRWVHGYSRRRHGLRRAYAPLWRAQVDDPSAIGFLDLLELRMVSEFVNRGVALNVIRATIERAREQFSDDYPLTTHRFLTDGKRIFLEVLEEEEARDDDGSQPMLDVAAQQRVINSVIRPALLAGIEFTDGRAQRWFPMRQRTVVLDPRVAFGAPSLLHFGIRTDTIAAALEGEGSPTRVAALFDIPPSAVRAAAAFERRHAA